MSIATQNNRDLNQDIFFTSGPNLVILAWMGYELWCGQAQDGVNSEFEVKIDLEGQSQLPPTPNPNRPHTPPHKKIHKKTLGTLTKVFCTFGSNLAILAWTGTELWCADKQVIDKQTNTHTDAGNDSTLRTKLASGKNERVNMSMCYLKAIKYGKDSNILIKKVEGVVER